ncbi:thioesterase family protein [Novosphingobium sp. KCTC 2891]|uniref:thioesterase family protein n=1 Tax=Novosphingobium sp. KCTC 2891 TaxID=2989730 RepID=UPI0022229C44|nr:thioesterase family protein [Novosphingobium sp. KCTC 2891]MCW1383663.1 thioesterase family protein [Novosphingobium sp. KCTC 2891]
MGGDATDPMPACYFEAMEDGFVPTRFAHSPWDPRAIAGGPVSALLASAAEDPDLDEALEVARFQVDIFGKVPHQPLTVARETLRDGRQTKLHRLTLQADGRPVAQAHILRVRRLETPAFPVPAAYPHPDATPQTDTPRGLRMRGGIVLREVAGGPGRPGRGVAWLAMNAQVIAGRTPSNFVKACLFADFGNGFGSATDAAEWSFANLDITLQFLRAPRGDWFLIDAETHMAGNGHGTAHSIFSDVDGVYARGMQTVFVAPGHLAATLPPSRRAAQ